MDLSQAATPVTHDGSRDVGVMLSHGFTGTPDAMRALAQACIDQGWSVRCPLLPGHGTTWQDLNTTQWTDWAETIEQATTDLLERCETVVVVGLSMGGSLATLMAEEHPEVAGLFLINPAFVMNDVRLKALPFVTKFVKSIPAIAGDIKKEGVREAAYERTPLLALRSQMKLWEKVTDALPELRTPTVLVHSREDHVVPPECSALFLERTGSVRVKEVLLDNSFHVATVDHDAELIENELVQFVSDIASRRARA